MIAVEALLADELITSALTSAGWDASYQFNADQWLTDLAAEGFSVNALGEQMLHQFGNLRVDAIRTDSAVFGSGQFNLDPLLACTGESARIVGRESLLGTSLCPIGEWDDVYILLAGGDGCVYAEATFQVLRIGNSAADALRRLIVSDTPATELYRRPRSAPTG